MSNSDIFLPYATYQSKIAAEFIQKWEGFSEQAYRCPGGILTIGYGHTLAVREGDRISRLEADRLLIADVDKVKSLLASHIKVPVTEGQFIALTSLAFNVGIGYMTRHCPKLMSALNSKNYEECAVQFLDIVKANGKILPGLVKRREAEAKIFLGK